LPTTTNYGWTTPADTDLVKDGAAAIRTLGSSVDTTLKTQIDNTVASSIQKTLTTTTGDVIYASGANTPARLGIGTTGQVLTVAGGVPSWATSTSGGLTLLSTTTLSGTSTTVSSINQTYTNLHIFVTNATASAGYTPRFNPNGTAGLGFVSAITSNNADTQGGTNFDASNANQTYATTGANAHTITINNYASTSQYKTATFFGASSVGNGSSFFAMGLINTTSAITSVTFTTFNGTASFTGGTMLIYGVK